MGDILVGNNYINKRGLMVIDYVPESYIFPNPIPSRIRIGELLEYSPTSILPHAPPLTNDRAPMWVGDQLEARISAQLLVLCSSYSICCEMPILILNVTTGVTFKYKYHKLASLTSQSGEYSWLLLQITESTAQFSQSASRHKTFCYVYQCPVTTGNAINMRCVVFCAGAKYITPWLPPSSCHQAVRSWSPHSGDVPQIWYQVLVVTIDSDGHPNTLFSS